MCFKDVGRRAMVTVTSTEPASVYRGRIVEGDCHLAAKEHRSRKR